MSFLWDKSPERVVEFALETLITKGFECSYYDTWQEFAVADYDEDPEHLEDYNLRELQSAWEALLQYVPKDNPVVADNGLIVSWVADQSDGEAQSTDAYFVVFKVADPDELETRFFLHDGYYSSYGDGGHLEDGESREVFPKAKLITVWRNK